MSHGVVRASRLSVASQGPAGLMLRPVTVAKLAHPAVYLIILVLLYGFSLSHTSIMGWASFTYMDARYSGVYAGYVLFFAIGMFTVASFPGKRAAHTVAHVQEATGGRALMIFVYSLVCVSAMTFKAGGLAIFSEDAMIFRRDSIAALGGYVGYPALLITPLGAVFAWLFVKTKRPLWAALALCCVSLQVLQLNRQEMVVIVAASLLMIFFFRRVSVAFLLASLLGLVTVVYALGWLAIYRRGGVHFFTEGAALPILPFYVVLEDFVFAVKLAHYTTDVVGVGGFQGRYVLGYFLAVAMPGYGREIGGTIVQRMLEAETSQSIGAPLSFFADGGMAEVLLAGFAQGWLAYFLYRKALDGSVYGRLAYALNLLNLMFHIRGGLVAFDPVWIYEVAALSFVFGPGAARTDGRFFLWAMRVAFVLTIPVTLTALAVRM